MKILIVDDSPAMRMIVMRTLRQAGFGEHKMDQAGSGDEALASIGLSRPDLVLCDWNMPGMTGIELLHKLKEDGVNLRFGFITSEATNEMCHLATEAGALFFVTKPFTAEALEKAIGPLLR